MKHVIMRVGCTALFRGYSVYVPSQWEMVLDWRHLSLAWRIHRTIFLEHVHKIPLQCLFILDELSIRSHVRKSIPVNWHEFSGIASDCLIGVYLRKNNLKKTLLGKKNFPTLLLIGWQYSHQPVKSHFGKSVWNDKIYLTQLLISWLHCDQPIRSHVRKSLLTGMKFNRGFSSGIQFTGQLLVHFCVDSQLMEANYNNSGTHFVEDSHIKSISLKVLIEIKCICSI